jgi:hypothetical protein
LNVLIWPGPTIRTSGPRRRHGAAQPETCDDIGVFCWLVKTPLGTALKLCSGHGRKACGTCPGIGARQAKAALAHGDGPGGDLE